MNELVSLSTEENKPEAFEAQVNNLLTYIQGAIQSEHSEQQDLYDTLIRKVQGGDLRPATLEQVVRLLELKSGRSGKLTKLLDTFAKVKKDSNININIGMLNMTPEDRTNFLKSL